MLLYFFFIFQSHHFQCLRLLRKSMFEAIKDKFVSSVIKLPSNTKNERTLLTLGFPKKSAKWLLMFLSLLSLYEHAFLDRNLVSKE